VKTTLDQRLGALRTLRETGDGRIPDALARELDAVLVRVGERYERQVSRMVERLAALLEPAVIIVLAFFIGTVVMAAVLPLIRLQEVL
jgi:hypothetical protein